MIQKLYRFAGLEFALSFPEDMVYRSEYWLKPFVADQVENPHTYFFTRETILPEPLGQCISKSFSTLVYTDQERRIRYSGPCDADPRQANTCVIHDGMKHFVRLLESNYSGRISVGAVLNCLDVNYLFLNHESVILHASFIEWEGKALLFTAPCQTGKSTQARLWETYRDAEIINGDRVVIRIAGNQILAEGLPFCGTSQKSKNRSLPLVAVVYLAQAPVTTIRRLKGYEAFLRVWEGILVDTNIREDLEKASRTVEKIAAHIPVYHMACTPDKQAVEALEKTLRKQEVL